MKKIMILILFLLAGGCQSPQSRLPILDDPACQPPCWQNIVPGETGKEELLNRLSSLPFVNKESVSVVNSSESPFMEAVYASMYLGQPFQTKLDCFLLDDKVAVISLGGTWHITLAETIEKLGTPQNVIIVPYYVDVYVTLVDPATGVFFGYTSLLKDEKWRKEMAPDIEIEWLNFFDPKSYVSVLDSGILSWWFLDPEQTARVTYPWNGYGNLDEKYPPRKP